MSELGFYNKVKNWDFSMIDYSKEHSLQDKKPLRKTFQIKILNNLNNNVLNR